MIDQEYIESILKSEEIDYLVCFPTLEMDEIAKTICAFLNSKGGRLLIGIDKKGRTFPISSFEDMASRLRTFLYMEISPASLFSIRSETFRGTGILLIEVIEGNRRPYSFRNQTFVRINGTTVQADENEMSKLIRIQRVDEYSWEKSPTLEATTGDLNMEEVKNTIRLANRHERAGNFSEDNPEYFLESLQLVRNNRPTNAAIILFGKEPTYFIPQCRVRIVEFPEGKVGNRYDNTVLIESNLFEAFSEIQGYFKRNIRRLSFFDDRKWERQDRMEFPLSVLDEAVINAMMHRDYSDSTGEVLIAIYRDRIEISNSGELPAGLKDKDLKENHRSIPPNPGMTHVVFLAGMIEKLGRGTLLITKTFEEMGLMAPSWVTGHGSTTLTLDSRSVEITLNHRMKTFLSEYQGTQLFRREEYEFFFQDGEISERTARNDISILLNGRWIEKIGDGASTRYKIIKRT